MKAVAAVTGALLAGALLAARPADASLVPPGASARRNTSEPARLPLPAAAGTGLARGAPPPGYPTQVSVSPSPARIGQRLAYRANLLVETGVRVRFDRPVQGGEFTWGAPRTGRTSVTTTRFPGPRYVGVDSVWMEAPLQVFASGRVSIPGPAIEVTSDLRGRAVLRLPTVHLVVLPTITAADSNAQLRALHGPLRAPWWERVPWRLVAAGALLVAALVGAVAMLRRRRRRATPPPAVPLRPQPVRDPGTEALAELAKLRALRLPEAGRFADHAFALNRILHRYLEAVVGTPRPGDTSGELVSRLRQSKLPGEDVSRLEGLLGLWDRVKFARAPVSVDEAVRCEAAVESLVRRDLRGAA